MEQIASITLIWILLSEKGVVSIRNYKGKGQTDNPTIQNRAFVDTLHKQGMQRTALTESKGPDQAARMRRLIWAFAVWMPYKIPFHLVGASIKLQLIIRDIRRIQTMQWNRSF